NSEYFSIGWKKSTENIIWNVRVPRVILAFITGASLSLVGITMQTITKNNLADPYILGISSGASAGAVSVIILSNSYTFLKLLTVEQGAFIGALISIYMVFFISSKQIFNGSSLILTGVGVSAFFSACTTVIIYSSKNNSQLVTAMFWMTGSLSSASWDQLFYPLLFLFLIFIAMIIYSYELDILLMGDSSAKALGINTGWIKLFLIILSTLLTSIIVSLTGIIGFVGLVIPHISRKIIGYKHKYLTVFSVFAGGLFLVISDTFARTYFSPEEMPIGVITAFYGTPLFLWIIRKNYSYGGKE
ncbi:MAG: FecCD family ABC transporter permease, partial [Fusobacteriaceae bacterium]